MVNATSTSAKAGRLPQCTLSHQGAEEDEDGELKQSGEYLPEDSAEEVGGLSRGGGEEAAQGALLAFVGKHGGKPDQGDEDPGEHLPGGTIELGIVLDLIRGESR